MLPDLTDCIQIRGLELQARVGVSDEERSKPQRVVANISLWPADWPHDDEIETAVDYSDVATQTLQFVGDRCDKLIETLADSVARYIIDNFDIRRVAIELRKFPLKEAEYVSVTVTRDRQ